MEKHNRHQSLNNEQPSLELPMNDSMVGEDSNTAKQARVSRVARHGSKNIAQPTVLSANDNKTEANEQSLPVAVLPQESLALPNNAADNDDLSGNVDLESGSDSHNAYLKAIPTALRKLSQHRVVSTETTPAGDSPNVAVEPAGLAYPRILLKPLTTPSSFGAFALDGSSDQEQSGIDIAQPKQLEPSSEMADNLDAIVPKPAEREPLATAKEDIPFRFDDDLTDDSFESAATTVDEKTEITANDSEHSDDGWGYNPLEDAGILSGVMAHEFDGGIKLKHPGKVESKNGETVQDVKQGAQPAAESDAPKTQLSSSHFAVAFGLASDENADLDRNVADAFMRAWKDNEPALKYDDSQLGEAEAPPSKDSRAAAGWLPAELSTSAPVHSSPFARLSHLHDASDEYDENQLFEAYGASYSEAYSVALERSFGEIKPQPDSDTGNVSGDAPSILYTPSGEPILLGMLQEHNANDQDADSQNSDNQQQRQGDGLSIGRRIVRYGLLGVGGLTTAAVVLYFAGFFAQWL